MVFREFSLHWDFLQTGGLIRISHLLGWLITSVDATVLVILIRFETVSNFHIQVVVVGDLQAIFCSIRMIPAISIDGR